MMSSGNAQIIKSYDPDNDLNKLIFNEAFIKKNNIKKINGQKSYKKRGDMIRQSQEIEFFEFHRSGDLKQFGYTSFNTKDTIYQFFDLSDQLIMSEGIRSRAGETVDEYEYNDIGQPVSKTKVKYYTDLEGKQFKTIISEEKITYKTLSDTSWKATNYNNYEKPYKATTFTYNKMDFLTEEKEVFLIGNRQIITSYVYNEMGLLNEIKVNKKIPEKTLFHYNGLGDLIRLEYFKNGVLDHIHEFFYDENTALLSSSFSREEVSGFINIVKYDFEFY